MWVESSLIRRDTKDLDHSVSSAWGHRTRHHLQSRKRVLTRSHPANTVTQPPEWCWIKFLLFIPPSLWYFVMEAQANTSIFSDKNVWETFACKYTKYWKEMQETNTNTNKSAQGTEIGGRLWTFWILNHLGVLLSQKMNKWINAWMYEEMHIWGNEYCQGLFCYGIKFRVVF